MNNEYIFKRNEWKIISFILITSITPLFYDLEKAGYIASLIIFIYCILYFYFFYPLKIILKPQELTLKYFISKNITILLPQISKIDLYTNKFFGKYYRIATTTSHVYTVSFLGYDFLNNNLFENKLIELARLNLAEEDKDLGAPLKSWDRIYRDQQITPTNNPNKINLTINLMLVITVINFIVSIIIFYVLK